ncbi:MAG: helix-turn-helix transcriptional regulator [Bacteriovoracaceae bacterium]
MKTLLSKNLKILLKERDLTVAQLSRASKVPAQTINNWLAGLEPRNMTQVKIVSQFFKITLDELAYGEKPIKIENKLKDYEDEIFAGIFEVVLRRKK